MTDVEASRLHHLTEIREREFPMPALAIHPYRPDEERIDNLRVGLEEPFKVEHSVVVERYHHTYLVQTLSIALIVLDGIDIRMKDVGVLQNKF